MAVLMLFLIRVSASCYRYDDVWVLDMKSHQWSSPRINGKKPAERFGQSQVRSFSFAANYIFTRG